MTEKRIEEIRRRKKQLLRIGHSLNRSGYKQLAIVIYQIADDIEALIDALTK